MARGKYEQWRTEEGLTLLRGWKRDGLTDEQIAGRIGVRRQTVYEWAARYPDIADALRRGRDVCDYAMEDTLYHRAHGYDYVETRTEYRYDENGNQIPDREIRTVKHVPPDGTALAMWLKNRRPEVWRDRPEETHADAETGLMLLPEINDG